MDAIKIISQDLFDKIRSRFSNLEMGDDAGGVTIDPSNAYYFDFDFVIEGSNLGRVSISLGDLGSLKVYYSQGITENQDDPVKKQWYSFLREMRFFAMRRKLRFDTRDITKTNLDKNDFQHLAATQGPKEELDMNTMNETKRGLQEGRDVIATGTPDAIKLKIKELGLGTARRESTGSGGEAIFVFRNPNYYVSQGQDGAWVLVQTNTESDQQGVAEGEHTMNESRWSEKSSRKTSRAVQGKTEVIVRHESAVDETYAGARSQRKNIKAIFIQNSDGERWKCPLNYPALGFAMAQHVDHGGVPHDPAGKAIIDMGEQIGKLNDFHRKINSSTLNLDAHSITERAMAHLAELKNRMGMLSKRHHYQQWISEFQEPQDAAVTELDAVTMEDYKSKFTQTSFQEELSGYFPLLHRIMGEANTVDLEDFVKESNKETNERILGALAGGTIGAVAAGPLGMLTGAAAGDSLTDPDNDEVEKEDTNRLGIGQQMARDGIKYSPDKENELIDLMVQYMKKNGMSSKEIRYRLNYDEDYIPDQLSDLPKEGSSEGPPFDPDTQSNFSKPTNPNRTGMDSARALAQRGMSPAESINAFEEWAEATASGEIDDNQVKALADAIAKLPTGDNGKPELKLGQDGSEATMFFSNYGLDNMDLQTKLKDAANGDKNADPFQVLKSWAVDDKNYPELMQRIGMKDAEQPPEQEPAVDPNAAPADPAAPPPEQGEEDAGKEPKQSQGTMFQEIAKIVSGRFNKDNKKLGAFNGETNIALEVKKEIAEKFGDEAGEMSEQLALKFMEKLSADRDHGPVGGDGLARMKEIMRHMGVKVEGMGQPDTDEAINKGPSIQRFKDRFGNQHLPDWHPSKHVTDPQKQTELAPYAKLVKRSSYADRAKYLDVAGVPDDRGPQGEGVDPVNVPAYIRQSKEPGKQAAQAATDKRNKEAGAKVWSSPRLPKESFELESIMKLAGLAK